MFEFEKIFVINLDVRKERMELFFQSLPQNWELGKIIRWEGIDGRLVPPPVWWKGGPGAWGCNQSHLRILEYCLNHCINSVMILEDDAVFDDNFTEKYKEFTTHLPNDWSIIYLGGQHIQLDQRLPRKVNDWVYRPYNVNRRHCYALRNRESIALYYRHLTNFLNWNAPHFGDHWLGELHKTMSSGLYCPKEWLVAQREGFSDICRQNLKLRFFTGAENIVYPSITLKGIVLTGFYGKGISKVAEVLSLLGIPFGTPSPQKDHQEKIFRCPFEDEYLQFICHHSFSEPWLSENIPYEDRANYLRNWAGRQSVKYSANFRFFAGKHPILTLMGAELIEAWNDPFFIFVDQSFEECWEDVKSFNWEWHPQAIKYAFDKLRNVKENFLEYYSPRFLRLSPKRLFLSPVNSIQEICDFLDYTPTQSQLKETLEFLRKR